MRTKASAMAYRAPPPPPNPGESAPRRPLSPRRKAMPRPRPSTRQPEEEPSCDEARGKRPPQPRPSRHQRVDISPTPSRDRSGDSPEPDPPESYEPTGPEEFHPELNCAFAEFEITWKTEELVRMHRDNALDANLRRAVRAAQLKWHPDKHLDDPQTASLRF